MLFINMQKLITNTWKIMTKNKKSFYLKDWNVNNLHGCAMSQRLPLSCFKWVEEKSQLNEIFIKNYNDDSDEYGYFFEIDVQYPKN